MGKSKPYPQKYVKDWEKEVEFRGWLKSVTGDDRRARCTVCSTTLTAKKKDLQDHAKTEKHKKAVVASKCSPKITDKLASASGSDRECTKRAELRTALFVAEHGSNASADHLSDVIASLDPHSNVLKNFKLHRTKCSGIINNVIGPILHEELLNDIGQSYFSLILDESTDISTTQCLGIMVRYFSKKMKKVVTSMYRLIELQATSAEAILEALLRALDTDKLQVSRLVGIGVDGASAMVGRHHSVSSMLKEKVPHLVVVRCICHSLHLAASYASAVLPRHLDYMVRETYSWFSCSAKRQREYARLYSAMNDGSRNPKISKIASTRWLSRGNAVAKIIEQYEELKLTFQLAKDKERCFQADQLWRMYEDKQNLLYLSFMNTQLSALNRINKIFQSSNPDPCAVHRDLHDYICGLLDQAVMPAALHGIRTSLEDLSEISVARHLIPARAIYFGHDFSIVEMGIQQEVVAVVREKCRDFLLQLIVEVQKRLPDNIKLLSQLSALSPEEAMKANSRSIIPIATHRALAGAEPEHVEVQWRALRREDWNSVQDAEQKGIDRESFWSEVGEKKLADGEVKYQNVHQLATSLLTMPISNAEVERLFSQMNCVKTGLRNRMQVDMLESVLRVRSRLHSTNQTCVTYPISAKMLSVFRASVVYDGEWPEGL
ncbi:uncharacterized protein LOC122370000 [Amphibalanus amphitrite]|uniref:uncharacterized protein LOC122370000 n=1 Tax=Amphibalanus amphitrite TaxID=1232801 RepID=UPI001C929C21|nr:uncharacterized protein LOC122370000 [Amphibalanus amphitrite]